MIDKVNLNEAQAAEQLRQARSSPGAQPGTRESFDAILRKELGKLQEVKFSAHALSRIASRNIRMSESERMKIADAMDKAQAKGAQDSLLLLDRAALIVSIKNRTVVTVLDREEMRGNVFTNIDSAIVMDGA
jgi:flagellar operon protein